MEKNSSRRLLRPATPPRLPRSRSVTSATSQANIQLTFPRTNYNPRSVTRANSTEISRGSRSSFNPSAITSSEKKSQKTDEKESFVKLLKRSSSRSSTATKMTRSCPGSPSAWALSPGRSSTQLFTPPEALGRIPPTEKRGGRGGGVRGVLKYFKQKKVSPAQEEESHQFRILHNRLVQWRFANARAESAMNSERKVAEYKLFCVWMTILKMRNNVLERALEVQKIRYGMKLYEIICPHISLLDEWVKLEKKNLEAVSRMGRKLSALSVRLPLVHGAEASEESTFKAMSTAMGVMDSVEAIISASLPKADTVLYLLMEMSVIFQQEEEYVKELEDCVYSVKALAMEEKTLRVQLMQANKESTSSTFRG